MSDTGIDIDKIIDLCAQTRLHMQEAEDKMDKLIDAVFAKKADQLRESIDDEVVLRQHTSRLAALYLKHHKYPVIEGGSKFPHILDRILIGKVTHGMTNQAWDELRTKAMKNVIGVKSVRGIGSTRWRIVRYIDDPKREEE